MHWVSFREMSYLLAFSFSTYVQNAPPLPLAVTVAVTTNSCVLDLHQAAWLSNIREELCLFQCRYITWRQRIRPWHRVYLEQMLRESEMPWGLAIGNSRFPLSMFMETWALFFIWLSHSINWRVGAYKHRKEPRPIKPYVEEYVQGRP